MIRDLVVRLIAFALLMLGVLSATAGAQTQWKAAVDGNWKDDVKWMPGTSPNAAATQALIGVGGAAYQVTLDDGDKVVKSLQLTQNTASLWIVGRALTIDNGLFTLNQGTLHLNGGTIKKGAVAAGLNFGQGTITAEGNSFVTGMVTNKADGTFRVVSYSDAASTLTFDEAFNHAKGLVELRGFKLGGDDPKKSEITLKATKSFLNAADGILRFTKGDGDGGRRIFSGNLLNQGKVQVGFGGAAGAEGVLLGTAANQSYINDKDFTIDTAGATPSTLLADGNGFKPAFHQRNGKFTTGGAFTGRKIKFQYDGGEIDGPVFLERSDLGFNGAANALKPGLFFITGGAKGGGDTLFDTFSEMTTDIVAGQSVFDIGYQDMPWTGLRKAGNTQTLVNKGRLDMTVGSLVKLADDARVALGKDDAIFQNDGTFNVLRGTADPKDAGKRYLYGTLNNRGNMDVHANTDFQSANKKHESTGVMGMIGPKAKGDEAFVTVTMPITSEFTNKSVGLPKAVAVKGNAKFKAFKFNNTGTLKPGKLPNFVPDTGQLIFEGDDGDPLGCLYKQGDGGNIETLMNGYLPVDEYDMVRITGSAILEPGAYSDLFLGVGFYPVLGDRFNILTATLGISGSMVLHSNPVWNGLSFELQTTQTVDFESGEPIWAVQAVVVPAPGILTVGAVLFVPRRRRLG